VREKVESCRFAAAGEGIVEGLILACGAALWALRFAVGACAFSFLNVVIYRLPRREGVIRGRSHCPACGHVLSPGELIPLFSFIWQRGRCRACGARISLRYFLVELAGGIGFILCAGFYGSGESGLLSLRGTVVFLFLAALTAVAGLDMDTHMIPDRFPLLILALGFFALWLFPEVGLKSRLIGAAAVSLPMFLLALLIPGAFGGGDIKLMAACGFLLGWKANVFAAFVGLLTGGLYCAVMLAKKKLGRKEAIAFGPFLAAGLSASAFCGERAVDWYVSLLR